MLVKHIDLEIEYAEANKELCPNGQCSIIKTAQERPQDIFDGVTIKKNHAYLYVIAMGAGDFYGENKNGDFFWEKDLIQYHDKFLDAGIFIQHDNKDPNKSIGKVLKSIYNNKMHRVELLLEIKKELAPQIYEAISNNERIAVSMGVKVPSETCSYCGQVTKGSIANRCEHLKFYMHQLMPNGVRVAAINNPPLNFFDISVVRKPADHQGYALFQKVASYETIDKIAEEEPQGEVLVSDKTAGLRKLAELTKRINALATYNPLSFNRVSELKQMPRPLMKNFIKSNDLLLHPAEYLALFNEDVDADRYDDLMRMGPDEIRRFFSIMLNAPRKEEPEMQVKVAMRHNEAMDYLIARDLLMKTAENQVEKYRNMDTFGNKEIVKREPTTLIPAGMERYAGIRIKLINGDTATQSPVDFAHTFDDLIDSGLVEEITGILPNGREVRIKNRVDIDK